MIMPLTTWNLLDFRVAKKEKLLKHYLFAQPWRSRLTVVSFSCNSSYFESYQPKIDWTNCTARALCTPVILMASCPRMPLVLVLEFESRRGEVIHLFLKTNKNLVKDQLLITADCPIGLNNGVCRHNSTRVHEARAEYSRDKKARHEPQRGGSRRASFVTPDLTHDYTSNCSRRERGKARHEPQRGGGRRACFVTPDLTHDYYTSNCSRREREVKEGRV